MCAFVHSSLSALLRSRQIWRYLFVFIILHYCQHSPLIQLVIYHLRLPQKFTQSFSIWNGDNREQIWTFHFSPATAARFSFRGGIHDFMNGPTNAHRKINMNSFVCSRMCIVLYSIVDCVSYTLIANKRNCSSTQKIKTPTDERNISVWIEYCCYYCQQCVRLAAWRRPCEHLLVNVCNVNRSSKKPYSRKKYIINTNDWSSQMPRMNGKETNEGDRDSSKTQNMTKMNLCNASRENYTKHKCTTRVSNRYAANGNRPNGTKYIFSFAAHIWTAKR